MNTKAHWIVFAYILLLTGSSLPIVHSGQNSATSDKEHQLSQVADWIVDLGPGAGPDGGELLYAGPLDGLFDVKESVTGRSIRSESVVRYIYASEFPSCCPKKPNVINING
jgi:hypothetical protein